MSRSPRSRLVGLDVARAVAIVGMLVAHFVTLDGTGGWWRVIARVANGKAMPLFVVLGGVGFTLLTRRAAHPVAAVLGRAVCLLVVGLVMVEHVPLIAVILHFYAAYFVVGLVVRRVPSNALLVLAVAVVVAGAVTWQHVAPDAQVYDGWRGRETVQHPGRLLSDVFVSGLYPVLPSFGFFAFGMWIGRLRLDDLAVVRRLAFVGLVLTTLGYGVGGLAEAAVTDRSLIESRNGQLQLTPKAAALVNGYRNTNDAALAQLVEIEVERTGETRRRVLEDLVVAAERAAGEAPLSRWFDTVGHGNMPAWVVGSSGLSALIIGLSSLAAAALPTLLLRPVAALGEMALSAYVGQGVVLRWWYPEHAGANGFYRELWLVLGLSLAFMALATTWLHWRRRGPLEWLLRTCGEIATLPWHWSGSRPTLTPADR